jgi:hypothetical protein
MTFRLGIDIIEKGKERQREKNKYVFIYKIRQIQGCEVNDCLHLDATKPKSVLNKVKRTK